MTRRGPRSSLKHGLIARGWLPWTTLGLAALTGLTSVTVTTSSSASPPSTTTPSPSPTAAPATLPTASLGSTGSTGSSPSTGIDLTPAQTSWMPPWLDEKDIPLPSGVTSAIVLHDDQPIQFGPRADASRRGSAIGGSRLPIFAARRGSGCAGRWLNIGPQAWICQDRTQLSTEPALAAGDTPRDEADGLPFRYYFVGSNGSAVYSRLDFAEIAAPDMEMQPGFAVAVVEQRARGEDLYGRTHQNKWIPMRDLGPVRTQNFHGEEIPDGKLDIAWVLDDRTPVFSKPDGSTKATDLPFKMRFSVVHVLEEKGAKDRAMLRFDDTHWLRAKDVRRPVLVSPPAEVARTERWIDVELSSQTMVAYQGDRPVFATLVSTGKGAQGTATATPKGINRIWVKLRTSTMDNLEDENARSTWAIEDVPHVQYFSKGVGIHAAFWHSGFGRVRSHGCVNLSPLDAQRIFKFTGPRVPADGGPRCPPSSIEGRWCRCGDARPCPSYATRPGMAGIKGAESMSAEQIVREIDRGAKVVVFDYCISILVLTFSRKSDPIFIPHGNGTFGAALPYIVCSFLFGWWGFPFGLIYTPLAIAKNLGGGTDVSQMVRAQLT